jgi:peptide/nickel transport system ATP-binding protein
MTQTITPAPAERDTLPARSDLDVERLSVAYAERHVVQDVSFQLHAGEVVGLIGESGSGKTTIARAVLGTVPSARGHLTVNGRRTNGFSARHQRRFRREGHAQYVFQDPFHSLDERFTALQAVRQGARETFGKKAADEHARNALQAVQLHERLWHRRPGGLSGGQRQRVAIARALAVDPAVLVCDEPVSALDASSRIDVVRTLRRTADARTGILLISHDLSSLSTIADRILVLNQGRIVESGTTSEVLGDPRHPYTRELIAAVPTIEGATGQPLPAEPEPHAPTTVERPAQRTLELS